MPYKVLERVVAHADADNVKKTLFHCDDWLIGGFGRVAVFGVGLRHPFGLHLDGATSDDVKELLSKENEGKPIDSVFPDYRNWVHSKGMNFRDWFKSTLEDFLDQWF